MPGDFSGQRQIAQFRSRQLGQPGSQARVDPEHPTLKERKGLRFRSQVLFLLTVFGWVAIYNVLLMAWYLAGHKPVCRWSLHRAPNCEALHVEALVGLLIGLVSMYRTLSIVVAFVRTPLFLLADEGDEPCHLQNAGKHHQEMTRIQSKRMAGAVVVIEVVVTVIPLNPLWYLLSVVPAINAAMMTMQNYFKM